MIRIAMVLLLSATMSQSEPLSVISAKRAEKYANFGSELTPREKTDVVLVVDVAGLSIEEFQRVQRDAKDLIYLTAGARKFVPGITAAGATQPIDASGQPTGPPKEERFIAVVVPRDVVDFTLHFNGRAVSVAAERAIAAVLP